MNDTSMYDWDNLNLTIDDYSIYSTPTYSTTSIIITVVVYVFIAICSVAGNTVVIWTICSRKSLKSAENYLIANIAIADILMALIYTPLLSMFIVNTVWPLGNYSCKLFEMVTWTTHSFTQFSLVAVSIIWFKIIVCPSQRYLTKHEGVMIAIGIWAVSFFISIPKWINESSSYCVRQPSSLKNAYNELFYLIFYTIWTYLFPAIWFICIYVIISDKLFRTYSLLGRSHDGDNGLKYTKQSVKMMILVTAIQIICLGPLTVLQVSMKFINYFDISELVLAIISFVAFSTIMWKPMFYLIINDKIRKNVKVTFTWFPFIQSDEY